MYRLIFFTSLKEQKLLKRKDLESLNELEEKAVDVHLEISKGPFDIFGFTKEAEIVKIETFGNIKCTV